MEVSISEGTYIWGLSWAAAEHIDFCTTRQNLKSLYRDLNRVQWCIQSSWSQQHLTLSRLHPCSHCSHCFKDAEMVAEGAFQGQGRDWGASDCLSSSWVSQPVVRPSPSPAPTIFLCSSSKTNLNVFSKYSWITVSPILKNIRKNNFVKWEFHLGSILAFHLEIFLHEESAICKNFYKWKHCLARSVKELIDKYDFIQI